MAEEDFACDKFVPQKWRADTCRNCYQSLRLHNKKQGTPPGHKNPPVAPDHKNPPVAPGAGVKSIPKVLERFAKKRDSLPRSSDSPGSTTKKVVSPPIAKTTPPPTGTPMVSNGEGNRISKSAKPSLIPVKPPPPLRNPKASSSPTTTQMGGSHPMPSPQEPRTTSSALPSSPPPQEGQPTPLQEIPPQEGQPTPPQEIPPQEGQPTPPQEIPPQEIPPQEGQPTPPQEIPPQEGQPTPPQEIPPQVIPPQEGQPTPPQEIPPQEGQPTPPQEIPPQEGQPTPPQEIPPQEGQPTPPQEIPPQEGQPTPPQEIPPQEDISLAPQAKESTSSAPPETTPPQGRGNARSAPPPPPTRTSSVSKITTPPLQKTPPPQQEVAVTQGNSVVMANEDLKVMKEEEGEGEGEGEDVGTGFEYDEEVKSKNPVSPPTLSDDHHGDIAPPTLSDGHHGDIAPPTLFSEDSLPPPSISFSSEPSPPPPHVVDTVPPPPLFAGTPSPPPPGTPSPPPPPGAFAGPPDKIPHIPPPPPIPPDGIPVAPHPPNIASPEATDHAATPPSLRAPPPDSPMAQAMESIRSGAVSLRNVPPPQPRPVGQDKVVDVASELRQKLKMKNKKKDEGVGQLLEEKRDEVVKMKELLVTCSGSHSFTHQLKALLMRVETFLQHVGLSQEVLVKKLEWPVELVRALRDVVQHMRLLEQRVEGAEALCQQTLANCGGVRAGEVVHVNAEAVQRCINDVARLARSMITEDSTYFVAAQSFPVDESDLQTFVRRAGTAVSPLLELLYKKAFATYNSIFEPSVSNFDKQFRVQNAQRLLKMCCSLSDLASVHLEVHKHEDYSQAQLKQAELRENYTTAIKVNTREGNWDTEEKVQLGHTPIVKTPERDHASKLVQHVVTCLSTDDLEKLEEELTPEKLGNIEVALLKAVLADGNIKLIEAAIGLTRKVYTEEAMMHCHDFDWLLDAVTKGNHDLIRHLVKSCDLNINCRNRGVGKSLLHQAVHRKDLPTAACLIRLGADPLIKDNNHHSPLYHLAIKCFPPTPFPTNTEHNEPMFNLSTYHNSPSLSDVVLVSDDGCKFFAHRIVLCVQSQVFKTMLDSDLWAESHNKEIPFPTVSGRVLDYMLRYLYTGACLFPRDDLNLAVELLGVADQFMLDPMKLQCETLLSDKIDAEVVIPLYYAAVRYTTPHLLANSTHFLLNHYAELEDQNHEVLLHILENSSLGPGR